MRVALKASTGSQLRMQRMRAGLCMAAVLLLSILLGLCSFKNAEAVSAEDAPSRAIAIAYDNSGSMAEGTDRWCFAQYSLEVLAAMMEENDQLSLFTMDSEGSKLNLSGSKSPANRVKEVHEKDLGVSDVTNPRAAQEAYQWLTGNQAQEKYLVITTDGEFPADREDDVRRVVEEAAEEGITVIYLAIGEGANASLITEDVNNGVYVKTASGDTILETMTETANLIFGRAKLEEGSVSTGDLTLEVPMGRLFVFAQGQNIEIGTLTDSQGKEFNAEVVEVRYREHMTDSLPDWVLGWTDNWRGDEPNRDLSGVVAIFDGDISKGTAHLDISGAETVDIYYQVRVGIEVTLTDTDDSVLILKLEPNEQNKLDEGEYQVSYNFIDLDDGERLDSSLLSNAEFLLSVEGEDGETTAKDGENISLSAGKKIISATARTVDRAKIWQNYNEVKVFPPATPFEISLISGPDEPLDVHNLNQAAPLQFQVTRNGLPLDAEEWAATSLTAKTPAETHPEGLLGWFFDSDESITFEGPTKEGEPGQFSVALRAYNGDPAQTLSGNVPIDVMALYDTGNGVSRGDTEEIVHIEGLSPLEKILSWIKLHLLQLFILLLLLLLLLFLLFEARKPRMPKISPKIVGVKSDDIPLVYTKKSIKHKIWPPWKPESALFKVIPKGGNTQAFKFDRRCHLGRMKTVEIVAARTKSGGRGFKISEASLAQMAKHTASDDLPDPCYAGEKQIFTPRSGFNFQGMEPHRRKGWDKPEEASYRITF